LSGELMSFFMVCFSRMIEYVEDWSTSNIPPALMNCQGLAQATHPAPRPPICAPDTRRSS
jgi:hypothetical protein